MNEQNGQVPLAERIEHLHAVAERTPNQNHADAVYGVIDAISRFDTTQEDAQERHNQQGAGIHLATVEARNIDWLWRGRLAVGMISILTGPGGLGKSSYARHLAAIVTNGDKEGWTMPDGTPCLLPGGVVTAFMEEPLEEIVVPRMLEAGVDVSRVKDISKIERPDTYGGTISADFSLARDLGALEDACQSVGASLVIIDSLTSALGGASQYNSQKVYDIFNALSEVTKRLGCAVLIIAHPPKNASAKTPSSFVSGTGGIFNRARIVDVMLPDAGDSKVTMIMNIKNNVHAPCGTLGFHRLPDNRLEFIHGKTLAAAKIQQVQRLGDTRVVLAKILESDHERAFTGQELTARLNQAGIKAEYGAVRVALSRMVDAGAICAPTRNAYADVTYLAWLAQQGAVTSVTTVTKSEDVQSSNGHITGLEDASQAGVSAPPVDVASVKTQQIAPSVVAA